VLELKTADSIETAALAKLHRAETAFREARLDYELKDRNSREAAKQREDTPDAEHNQEVKANKALLHDHAELAKTEYLKREEDLRIATQEHDMAVQNKIAKKTIVDDAEGELRRLEKAREVAGKRDDAIDARQEHYRTEMLTEMKSAFAFHRQQILMKQYQQSLMRAAVIAGLSQAYMDVMSRVYHTTYMSIMNRLMQG
jgi:hypothetical protein